MKGMRCNHVIDLQTDVTDVLDGHAKRVALYTELLLTELVRRGFQEIKQPDILKIKHATLLHDIGKCFIPKAILNKKGRLTDEEYAIVKLHTIKGAELIARCEDVLECMIRRCRWYAKLPFATMSGGMETGIRIGCLAMKYQLPHRLYRWPTSTMPCVQSGAIREPIPIPLLWS